MQNSTDLGQALKDFEKLLKESTAELQAKDKAFKDKEDETKKLKEEMDQMQREIETKRRQWGENERMLPKMRGDAERARIEHRKVLQQVETTKKNAIETLKGHKGGHSLFF
jgi:predicted  nucleic acid-binding Zn-ribbon protein